MFKKLNRLSAREKFFEESLNSRFFVLKISQNNLLHNRFGFVVSKKIDKRAVVRNSLKRKLRSCLEEYQKDIKPGFDFLFILKKEAGNKSQKELCAEVKAGLIKQKFL